MTTCHHCQAEFTPKRSTARFCGPTCRVAGHRQPTQFAPGQFLALQATQLPGPARSGADVTLRTPIPRALPAGIVSDARWPGMSCDTSWPEGGLSEWSI